MNARPNFTRPATFVDAMCPRPISRPGVGRASIPGRIVLASERCELLDGRTLDDGSTEAMYRLSRPLPSRAPAWRNVVVSTSPAGERTIYRGWAYKALDNRWLPVPEPQDWRQGMQPVSEEDRAFVEAEIASI